MTEGRTSSSDPATPTVTPHDDGILLFGVDLACFAFPPEGEDEHPPEEAPARTPSVGMTVRLWWSLYVGTILGAAAGLYGATHNIAVAAVGGCLVVTGAVLGSTLPPGRHP